MAADNTTATAMTADAQPADQPVKVTAEQLGVSEGEQYSGHLEFDLGNLMASEQGPIDRERFVKEPDAACLRLATQITQSLVARLFQLPSQAAPVGRIAQLPKPSTPLPRAKPVPQPRQPTKWEAFAQRKGIVKRKRGREVFDEDAGEYRRRHGYKRAGDESEVPIIEASASDAVGEDPFTKLKQEKKERVREQQKRQLGNIKANAKASGKGGAADTAVALPPTLRLAAGLPVHGKGKPVKRGEIKEDIKAASRQAGMSTASMGKFDERLPGEKPGERQAGSKRQKFEAVSGSAQAENAKAMGMVDRLLRERADDILDTDRAVRRVEAERHQHIGDKKPKEADSSDDEGPTKGGGKKGRGKKGGKPTSTKGQRFAGLKRGAGGPAKGSGGAGKGSKGRLGPKGKGGSMASGKGTGKGRPAGKTGGKPGKSGGKPGKKR